MNWISSGSLTLNPRIWISFSSRIENKDTWILGCKSGNSFRTKIHLWALGIKPKWMTSSSEYDNLRLVALIGSISPIKSETVTSGVASFS